MFNVEEKVIHKSLTGENFYSRNEFMNKSISIITVAALRSFWKTVFGRFKIAKCIVSFSCFPNWIYFLRTENLKFYILLLYNYNNGNISTFGLITLRKTCWKISRGQTKISNLMENAWTPRGLSVPIRNGILFSIYSKEKLNNFVLAVNLVWHFIKVKFSSVVE